MTVADQSTTDPADYPASDALTLDANAVAGMLMEIFGTEMTASMSRCGHCGNRGQVGSLRAYTQAPASFYGAASAQKS